MVAKAENQAAVQSSIRGHIGGLSALGWPKKLDHADAISRIKTTR
jgi:hypothetical protein